MTEQTKAQRLANMLVDWDYRHHIDLVTAAAELRRLDALVDELVDALSLIQPIQCDNLHHEKKHRHSYADSCPVKEWIDGVLAKAKEQT